MGQQQAKGGQPPNPNYGSGAGTDNSNGVYNASAALQAAQPPQYDAGLGAGTIGATGTTDPNTAAVGSTGATATQLPATQVQGGDQAQGLQGANPNGAAFANTARAGKGQSKGMTPQAPAGMQNAAMTVNGALAGGTTGQPPAYSTSYVPPPPATTAAPGASSPMSGSSLTVGDVVGQGKSAKGGSPAAPAGVGGQSGGQTGVAGATGTTAPGATGTTGPVDYAAQSGRFNAQNDPTGAWAKYYNNTVGKQKGAEAAMAASPWMKNLLTGVDSQGRDNKARSDLDQAALAAGKSGADIGFDHGTNTDWQSWVKKQSGESDPFAAMQKLAQTARDSKGGIGQLENMHRAMMADGISKNTADRVLELFHNTGSGQEQAARRLGVYEQWAKMTQGDKWQGAVSNELENEAWRRANPTLGNSPAYPTVGATGATGSTTGTGATGATGPLVGGRNATGTTGAPTTVTTSATTGPPTPATDPMPGGAPEPTTQQITQLAQKYMVSPDIARQIYRALLETSMSSGGGNSNNSGSGDGDGGGDE